MRPGLLPAPAFLLGAAAGAAPTGAPVKRTDFDARRFHRISTVRWASSCTGLSRPRLISYSIPGPGATLTIERKSVVSGKSVSDRVNIGGRRTIKTKKKQ